MLPLPSVPAVRGPVASLLAFLARALAPAMAVLALAGPAWADGDAIDLPSSVTKVEELGAKVFYLHDPEGNLTLDDVMAPATASAWSRRSAAGRACARGVTWRWSR